MRNRRPKAPSRRHPAATQPLPHPSWSPPREAPRVTAQEFWQRLGL